MNNRIGKTFEIFLPDRLSQFFHSFKGEIFLKYRSAFLTAGQRVFIALNKVFYYNKYELYLQIFI